MSRNSIYHGGLVFCGDGEASIEQFCRIVTATLEDYGHRVERQSVADSHSARVVTTQYMVKLSLDERHYRSDESDMPERTAPCHRLEISMTAADAGYEDRDISELMLVVMLYRMVDICNTLSIEWMDPGTVLTIDQFLSAFTNVSPHRVHSRPAETGTSATRFAPVEETAQQIDGCLPPDRAGDQMTDEEALAMAFRSTDVDGDGEADLTPEEAAQNDIRRLAAWGLTGMVAFMSAPVAASMAAVNLARGEDLRLNTQVLSLTGLLVVLHGTGALANMVNYLPI